MEARLYRQGASLMGGVNMSVTYQIVIPRATGDTHVLSFDLWAKRESAPNAVGDGIFVGNIVIGADETSVSTTYATPLDGRYFFLVIPRRNDQIGRETLL